jgi:hypothetical protein
MSPLNHNSKFIGVLKHWMKREATKFSVMAFIKKISVMGLPREIFVDVPIDQRKLRAHQWWGKRPRKDLQKGNLAAAKGRRGTPSEELASKFISGGRET